MSQRTAEQATPTTPSPSAPNQNPIDKFQNTLGINLPEWLFLTLSVLAALAILVALYKPLIELFAKLWKGSVESTKSRRLASQESKQRAKFAGFLRDELRSSRPTTILTDGEYAELEAEIEVDKKSAYGRLLERLGATVTPRIRRIPALTPVLRTTTERLVILEGDPGSGKSVALLHLAEEMLEDAIRRPVRRSVLPVYINMKTFRPKDRNAVTAEDVHDFVISTLNPARSRDLDSLLRARFDSWRQEGSWLFLFDSFDETPAILAATEAGGLIETYTNAIHAFLGIGASRGVIASRAFRGPTRRSWPRFRIMPLTAERRVKFIKNAGLKEPEKLMLIDSFDTLDPSVQRLADNPMFLSLLCQYVDQTSSFPERAHLVLEMFIRTRLDADAPRIESRFAVTTTFVRSFAEEMAFQMLASPDLGLSVGKRDIIDRVTERLNKSQAQGVAALGALIYSELAHSTDSGSSGDLEADVTVAFAHRRYQEYFATCVAIRDRDRIAARELIGNGRWRETAVAILQNQGTDQCEKLLVEAEAKLRSCFAFPEDDMNGAARRRSKVWPSGVLHILDLLANGLKPEDSSTLAVSSAADQLLRRAWTCGNRADKKWVVELCASAGSERAVDYLTMAFDSESLWLRDEAYNQVRRLGGAAGRLEPQIRQMLLDMSVAGQLRRRRRSISALLLRLSNPQPLQRVMRLVLAAPIASVIPSLFVTAVVLGRPDRLRLYSGSYLLVMVIASLISTVPSIFLHRFSLISDGRADRYSQGFLSKLGLADGNTNKSIAALASFVLGGSLGAGLAVMIFVHLGGAGLGDRGLSLVSSAMLTVLFLWLCAWPHAALRAASSGTWTEVHYWPVLPLYFVRRGITFLRGTGVTAVALWTTTMAALWTLLWLGSRVFSWFDSAIAIITVGPTSVLLLIFLWKTLRRAWWRLQDGRSVRVWDREAHEHDDASRLQAVLQALRTDEGVRLLLHSVRRRELQRVPEIAEFLVFLDARLDHRDWAGDDRDNWREWWSNGARASAHAPLLNPSSETRDELGRLIEAARRGAAFSSGDMTSHHREEPSSAAPS